jgi:excisionase family DNA binding protein
VGLTKEWHLSEQDDETREEQLARQLETMQREKLKEQARLEQERRWAAEHPAEWKEWVRVSLLLIIPLDLGADGPWGFPQFLEEIGARPTPDHFIERQNDAQPYGPGNLIWSKREDASDRILAKLDDLQKKSDRLPQEWLSIEQVAALTGLSEDHIRRAVVGGTLVTSNVGTPDRPLYRIRHENIEKWMKEREAGPKPPRGRNKKAPAAKKPLPVSPHFPQSNRRSSSSST